MCNSLIYTVKTAAALLECHPDTIRHCIVTGQLLARKRLRKWYILPDDLIRYVNTGDHSQRIAMDKQAAKRQGQAAKDIPGPTKETAKHQQGGAKKTDWVWDEQNGQDEQKGVPEFDW